MAKYVSPVNYSDEHMRLLGLIAAHWELLDFVLERAVAHVMMLDPNSVALLTANIDTNRKLDLLTSNAREAFQEARPDIWKEYTTMHARLLKAQGRRNDFVHSKWRQSKDGQAFGRTKIKTRGGKFKVTDVDVTEDEMADAAKLIYDVSTEFARFYGKIGFPLA